VTIWKNCLLYVFVLVFLSYNMIILAPPFPSPGVRLQFQLLLSKPADDPSRGKATHSHSLGHSFHRCGAIANSKHAGYIGFIEWRPCLDDALLIYTQSKLIGERSVGGSEGRGNLSDKTLAYPQMKKTRPGLSTYHERLIPRTAICEVNDNLRTSRIFSVQADDLPRLDSHAFALSRRQHLLGDVRIPIGVHHDILRQRCHHAGYMQHPLRIGDLASGDNTGRLPAGFFVAVANQAVETEA